MYFALLEFEPIPLGNTWDIPKPHLIGYPVMVDFPVSYSVEGEANPTKYPQGIYQFTPRGPEKLLNRGSGGGNCYPETCVFYFLYCCGSFPE